MRAELLSTLARLNITDYFHVWRVIKYTYNTSVEEALRQISLGRKIWESEGLA